MYGKLPGFAFVGQEGASEPAADSIRIPGSPLVLTRGEPTEIAVHNRLGFPIYHVHNERDRELASGLYGPFIVLEPGQPLDPDRDHILLLSEAGPFSNLGSERAPFVNGTTSPGEVNLEAKRTYRLRFISIPASDLYVVSIHPPEADERIEQIRQDSNTRRLRVCRQFDASSGLVTWRAVARDGAELPPAQREITPACFATGPGATFDFEFTPEATGSYVLLVNAVDATNGRPTAAVTVVPIEVRR